MSVALDAIDDAIVETLRKDGRLSNREIARTMGLSETNVRKRLRRMEDNGFVKLSVITDLAACGYGAGAFIRVQAIASAVPVIGTAMADEPEIVFVAACTGEYNLIGYVIGKDRPSFVAIIERISGQDGVRRIQVLEPTKSLKHRHDISVSSALIRLPAG